MSDTNPGSAITLSSQVTQSVTQYLNLMDGQPVTALYDLVLSEVEAPLLRCVLAQVGQNQSAAARMLGINRGTLRAKMRRYGML